MGKITKKDSEGKGKAWYEGGEKNEDEGEKTWNEAQVWSWQVCRLHPLLTPFISTPSTLPLPFPFPNYTAGD